MSSYTGMLCLVFGYIGMFQHKGRLIGGSCLVMAAGSLVMFLPHILAGNYDSGPNEAEFCDLSGTCLQCHNIFLCIYIYICYPSYPIKDVPRTLFSECMKPYIVVKAYMCTDTIVTECLAIIIEYILPKANAGFDYARVKRGYNQL